MSLRDTKRVEVGSVTAESLAPGRILYIGRGSKDKKMW